MVGIKRHVAGNAATGSSERLDELSPAIGLSRKKGSVRSCTTLDSHADPLNNTLTHPLPTPIDNSARHVRHLLASRMPPTLLP
jgi:hypothetical protein